jgi:hypothetical protein
VGAAAGGVRGVDRRPSMFEGLAAPALIGELTTTWMRIGPAKLPALPFFCHTSISMGGFVIGDT